jgi:hypothetical protein
MAIGSQHLRVFYFFERTGEQVKSSSPVTLSRLRVSERLLPRLEGEDDYLGLVDDADNVLQITRAPHGVGYRVELALTEERSCLGRTFSLSELTALLGALPPRFRPSAFPDFVVTHWGRDER